MNMISTGAFLNEMDASNKQKTLAEQFAAVWEKKNAKAARAGGVSLMALSLAACGGGSSTTSNNADTGGSTDTSSTTVKLANDGGTYSLTTTVDGVSAPTSSSAKIYLNDNEPGDAYSFTLDASAAGSGALVIEFADAGDTATLSADSSFGNFATLEVKNGTVDATAMTLPTGMNSVILNSGLKVTAAQGSQITSITGSGELTVEVSTQAEIDQVIAHMNTHGITASVKVAAASGSTLTADDISAGNTNVAAEAAGNVETTPVTYDAVSLKAGTDTETSDDFSGALVGAGANGSTINAGDNLTGTDGTADKLTITATGDEGAGGYTLAGVQTSGVETVQVSNFYTDGTVGLTVDMALMSGVKTVDVIASSATGDTTLSNVGYIIDAGMNSGAGDLDIGYQASVVTGTADAQNLTVSNTTAGTFTANSIETINITTGAVKATLADVVSDSLATVTIAGSKDLTVTNSLDFKATANGKDIDGTIDASSFSGKLTLTATTAQTVSITGGSGDDKITLGGTLTKNDVIDGGDGDDTLVLSVADTGDGNAATFAFTDFQLSNIETVEFGTLDTSGGTTIDAKALADTTTVSIKATTDDTDATVNNVGAGQAVTFTQDATGGAAVQLGDVAVNLEDDTSTSDSMTVNLAAKVKTLDHLLDKLTVDDGAEALTLNVSGVTTTGKDLKLTSLIADGAKTIEITGAGNFETQLNESGGSANKTTSVDASAATGEFVFTENVTNDITIKGSAGQNTIAMGATLDNKDTIVGGASAKDTVSATVGTATTATTGKFNITDVETLALTATDGQTATVDLSDTSGMTKATVLASSTTGNGVVNFTGLSDGFTIATVDEATNDFDGTITAKLADATGSSDSITLQLGNTNANKEDMRFTTTDIETITIEAGATAASADIRVDAANATNFIITGKGTGNIDLTEGSKTLNKSVTSVDASGFSGTVVVDASGTDSVGVNFNMGTIVASGADVITGSAATTTEDTLTGTLAATDSSAAFATKFNGIENYVLTLKDGVQINDAGNGGLADNDTVVKTITLSGGNTLTTYTQDGGDMDGSALTSFDASGLGGEIAVDVVAGLLDTATFKGSTASSKDALTVTGVNGLAKATTGKVIGIEGVETVHLQTATAASTLDLAAVTGATTIGVQGAQNVTLENVAAGTAVQLGTSAGTTEDDYSGTLTVKLADATGTDDSLTVKLVAQGADNAVDAKVVAAGVESATIDVATQTATKGDADLDISGIAATTLTVQGGTDDEDLDLSNGGAATLHANTDTVDASAFKGSIRIDAEANNATTFTVLGTDVATIRGSSGNDTLTVNAYAAETHDVDLGAGADTVNLNLKTGTSAMTAMEGVETYNIIVASDAGAVVTTADASKFYNDTMVQTVTLTGGSADSTFDGGTDPVDSSSSLTLFDASGFNGQLLDLEFDADQLGATIEVRGAASAKDNVTAAITSGGTVKMSGVENLTQVFGGTATVDVGTYVTGLNTIKLSSDGTARVATLNNMDAGVTVEITANDNEDGVTIVRNDASATDNVQDLEIKASGAGEDLLLDIANIETINIKSSATNAADLNMTNVDMDTTGATNSVVFTGTKNIDIITMSVDTTSVDASAMTAGGVDIDGRASGSTITYKGAAAAAESVIMVSAGDALDAGEKTGIADSLDINFGAVLGGISVDLTAADQVATMDGVANSAVQTGFENVDLAGYTGFGAVVTGNDEANIVTGTASADNIKTGAGDDTINVTSTSASANDVMDGGEGTSDTMIILATTNFADTDSNIVNIEKITHEVSGAALDLTGQTEGFIIDSTAGGAQTITGGSGQDTIDITGAGADVLAFVSTSGNDLVSGFTTAEDKINLHGITFQASTVDGAKSGTIANFDTMAKIQATNKHGVVIITETDKDASDITAALNASGFDADVDAIAVYAIENSGTSKVELWLASNADTVDDDDVSLVQLATFADIAVVNSTIASADFDTVA